MICKQCGKEFVRDTNRGPVPKFCSGACRQAKHRARHDPSLMTGIEAFSQFVGAINTLAPLTAACMEYRQSLEDAGYSPTMAEALAAELHRQWIIKIVGGMKAESQ